MSDVENLEKLEHDDVQQIAKDVSNGRRNRRFEVKVKSLAREHGLDPAVMWDKFLPAVGLPPFKVLGGDGASLGDSLTPGQISSIVASWLDETKKSVAIAVGLVVVPASGLAADWQGLIDFMNAMVPIIVSFMAACGA